MDGRAKRAQIYPDDLCVEVIKGFIDQMRFDGRIRDTAIGYVFAVEEGEHEVMFWDEVTGQPLDTRLVVEARAKEMTKFSTHGVYHKVPVEECWKKTGKAPLGTKWVDINKGDNADPDVRSRFVAKEIRRGAREDLFAATPPLEAKKMLFSMAVTEGIGWKGSRRHGMKLDFIDVSCAYLHAKANRDVFIKLPAEDDEEGMCGKLDMSLYGTRDAAQNWEETYSTWLISLGFSRGRASPCVFYHHSRKIRIVVHGDDFTCLGYSDQLDWLREQFASRFTVKFKARLGPQEGDDKSVQILNRVVTWGDHGIEYEPDQRHADIMVDELELSQQEVSHNPGGEVEQREGRGW